MSYLRGKYYSFGHDRGITLHGNKGGCGCNEHRSTPAIWIPFEVFDSIVLMRAASMTEEDRMKAIVYAIDHARGNGGAGDLLVKYGARNWYDEQEKWLETLAISHDIKEKPRAYKHHAHKGRKRGRR